MWYDLLVLLSIKFAEQAHKHFDIPWVILQLFISPALNTESELKTLVSYIQLVMLSESIGLRKTLDRRVSLRN